ncbi:MAG: ATP-binding protein, partial [Lentisphaerae bacterium]|nr:ATP-binding protein [Lentisphaerota bacterium]
MHATLCDYLADIAQNAIEAGASVIGMDVTENDGQVMVKVTDNGKGMDAATQARLWD